MSKAPIWPVATDALIADTTHLSAEEFGAYVLLMIAQWRSNGAPLPADELRLARMARLSPKIWGRYRDTIAELFEIGTDGWRQKRVQKDFLSVSQKIDQNRDNGSLGGKAKSLKYNNRNLANAENSSSKKSGETLAIHEPYPNPSEESSLRSEATRPKRGVQLPEGFPTVEAMTSAMRYWDGKGRRDLSEQCREIAEQFRDHHASRGTVFKDWDAGWRNWFRNAVKFEKGPQNGRKRTAHDSFAAAAATVASDFGGRDFTEGRDDFRDAGEAGPALLPS